MSSIFFNKDSAPLQLLPEQGPPGPPGPTGPQGPAGVSTWDDITGKPSTFSPSAHKASHATGGSDALTPSDIGAQSTISVVNLSLTANTTLPSARAQMYYLAILQSNTNYDVSLPTTAITGDIVTLRNGFFASNSYATIKESGNAIGQIGLISGRAYRYIYNGSSWQLDFVFNFVNLSDTAMISGSLPISSVSGLQSSLDFSTAITSAAAPATSGSVGSAGSIRYDDNYIYICTASNTWKRTAITSW